MTGKYIHILQRYGIGENDKTADRRTIQREPSRLSSLDLNFSEELVLAELGQLLSPKTPKDAVENEVVDVNNGKVTVISHSKTRNSGTFPKPRSSLDMGRGGLNRIELAEQEAASQYEHFRQAEQQHRTLDLNRQRMRNRLLRHKRLRD
uniref:Uncharacterized protein n=1 Tax=Tetraselmis sp. GSL018 TaxID=582737 RepID=A0A061RFL7_9CHLO